MTHMHIPTVPTARDRRKARAASHGRHIAAVPADSFDPLGIRAQYHGRHVARRRDCAPDWVNTARCTGMSAGVSAYCQNLICPKHQPEAYAEHMAKHTPETLIERAGMLLFLGEADQFARHARAEFIGRYVDVNL